jgi:hypothetical protein
MRLSTALRRLLAENCAAGVAVAASTTACCMGQLQPGLVLAVAPMGQIQGMPAVILPSQRIPVDNGPDCLTFWDRRSTSDMLTLNYAARVGLKGWTVPSNLQA